MLGVVLTEPVVSHARSTSGGAGIEILGMEEFEGDPNLAEFAMHFVPVGLQISAFSDADAGEEPFVHFPVGHACSCRPVQALTSGCAFDLDHAMTRNALRFDLREREALGSESEHQSRVDLSYHQKCSFCRADRTRGRRSLPGRC